MTFEAAGWMTFGDDALADWVAAVAPQARDIAAEPGARADWLRHGRTWFAGVNILPNDPTGRVRGGPGISGKALSLAEQISGQPVSWDRGQLSIVYPGYPKQDEGESDAAHRFRRNRDAAHVDGLLPVGPDRRRKMQEPHGFVLGIPLNDCSDGASPMVVWEGSHEIMRTAFRDALRDVPESDWGDADLTDVYQAARRRCFDECLRVSVHVPPGQGYVVHRLALHGVAPWEKGATAPPEGRMIAYFRPAFTGSNWIDAP
ncbi:MAG: hypothetical protein AAGF78_07095 [Pseudomonadota bacterium]